MSCFIPDRRIVIGKTKKKAIVTVCMNCSAYGIPHFNYISPKYEVTFSLLNAEFVDTFENIELEDRTDVEEFLNKVIGPEEILKSNKTIKRLNKKFFQQQKKNIKRWNGKIATIEEGDKYFGVDRKYIDKDMTYWDLIIKLWNEHNEEKVPKNIHKPYYRNFIEYIDTCTFSNKNEEGLNGGRCYTQLDQERIPNFHYKLKAGEDFCIMLEKPEYMYPIPRNLTDEEVDGLVAFMKAKRYNRTGWETAVWCWNDQNYGYNDYSPKWFPKYKKIEKGTKMPDYNQLKEGGKNDKVRGTKRS